MKLLKFAVKMWRRCRKLEHEKKLMTQAYFSLHQFYIESIRLNEQKQRKLAAYAKDRQTMMQKSYDPESVRKKFPGVDKIVNQEKGK